MNYRIEREGITLFNITDGPVGSGPAGNCTDFMKSLLREFVNTELTDLDIQMAHRTPTGKPFLELRPRPIHGFF